MITKTIKYTDYNGVEREEKFMFNLTEAELIELEMTTEGGLDAYINKIIETKEADKLIEIFKKLIFKAYGEKSLDGKRFVKKDANGESLAKAFSETEAYSQLFMELAFNSEAAANFIKGIIPAKLSAKTNDALKA